MVGMLVRPSLSVGMKPRALDGDADLLQTEVSLGGGAHADGDEDGVAGQRLGLASRASILIYGERAVGLLLVAPRALAFLKILPPSFSMRRSTILAHSSIDAGEHVGQGSSTTV